MGTYWSVRDRALWTCDARCTCGRHNRDLLRLVRPPRGLVSGCDAVGGDLRRQNWMNCCSGLGYDCDCDCGDGVWGHRLPVHRSRAHQADRSNAQMGCYLRLGRCRIRSGRPSRELDRDRTVTGRGCETLSDGGPGSSPPFHLCHSSASRRDRWQQQWQDRQPQWEELVSGGIGSAHPFESATGCGPFQPGQPRPHQPIQPQPCACGAQTCCVCLVPHPSPSDHG